MKMGFIDFLYHMNYGIFYLEYQIIWYNNNMLMHLT